MMTPISDDFILIFVGGPGGFTNEIKKKQFYNNLYTIIIIGDLSNLKDIYSNFDMIHFLVFSQDFPFCEFLDLKKKNGFMITCNHKFCLFGSPRWVEGPILAFGSYQHLKSCNVFSLHSTGKIKSVFGTPEHVSFILANSNR